MIKGWNASRYDEIGDGGLIVRSYDCIDIRSILLKIFLETFCHAACDDYPCAMLPLLSGIEPQTSPDPVLSSLPYRACVENNGIGLIGILGLLDSPSLQENLKRIRLGLIQLTPIGLYKILHFPLLLMAASSVFSISMETVISPTPPGTGVIETSRSLKES